MGISATKRDQRVANVEVTDSALIVALKDGREIRAPLAWFPRLASASPEQRAEWEISAAGPRNSLAWYRGSQHRRIAARRSCSRLNWIRW
jgi:hypothetical protein